MGEQNKILSRPIFRRDVSWDPFPNWTQPSRIFTQDFGLPPFLEPSDLDWLDWAKKRLGSFNWPGYTQTPLLPPFSGQHPAALKQNRQQTSGVSEIRTGQDRWKINLDVNHFSPEEIAITTKDGYLQISGILCMFSDCPTRYSWAKKQIMWPTSGKSMSFSRHCFHYFCCSSQGNHEERQDEHGSVSRCFTRKYK